MLSHPPTHTHTHTHAHARTHPPTHTHTQFIDPILVHQRVKVQPVR